MSRDRKRVWSSELRGVGAGDAYAPSANRLALPLAAVVLGAGNDQQNDGAVARGQPMARRRRAHRRRSSRPGTRPSACAYPACRRRRRDCLSHRRRKAGAATPPAGC